MATALITGASRGLGRALAAELATRGWDLIVDARDGVALSEAVASFGYEGARTPVPGDVADPAHRAALADAVRDAGRLDLLVNNASTLGASPLPTLDRMAISDLETVFNVNAIAPIALVQLVLQELLAVGGTVVNVTSDAAVEAYPGWGGYGASKAALEQFTAILAAEQPDLGVYAFDPGDMRTQMQQEAFPGEDISDRAEPETVVPALLRLIEERPPSGRHRKEDLLVVSPGR